MRRDRGSNCAHTVIFRNRASIMCIIAQNLYTIARESNVAHWSLFNQIKMLHLSSQNSTLLASTILEMKLANIMEPAVRAHLNQLRDRSADGDETCWCPLCRADTMALALSTLPPRYATRRPGALPADPQHAATVGDLVEQAMRQVARFPKHAADAAVAAGEPVWVVNFPLEESFRVLDAMVRSRDDVCDCWNCRCDMVAFALNRYPPRYGVEHRGVTHLLERDREQMRTELASFLDLSVRVVAAVPRHEFSTATI